MKEILKSYFTDAKRGVIVFTILTLLFYISNGIFFSNSPDVPIDEVFMFIYIIFIPGLMVLYTMIRTHTQMYHNKEYILTIMSHLIIPVIFSMICAVTYSLIMGNSAHVFNIIMVHFGSLPIGFMALLVALEVKLVMRGIWIRLGIFIFLVIILYGLNITFNDFKHYTTMLFVNSIFIFLIPSITLLTYYRIKTISN